MRIPPGKRLGAILTEWFLACSDVSSEMTGARKLGSQASNDFASNAMDSEWIGRASQDDHSSHVPERVPRCAAAFLGLEIGLIVANFRLLLLLCPTSRHETDFSLTNGTALSGGPLLGLHILGAGAEGTVPSRVGSCRGGYLHFRLRPP